MVRNGIALFDNVYANIYFYRIVWLGGWSYLIILIILL